MQGFYEMKSQLLLLSGLTVLAVGFFTPKGGTAYEDSVADNATKLFNSGRHTFRFDTFGDEAFWGGKLGLHKAIEGEANGGFGAGLSPAKALKLGLKVDLAALTQDVRQAIKGGTVDLNDPKTTLALLKLNAVVGVKGFFDGDQLTSVGITCALCHSNVDDAFASGIGHRLDGYPNQDLDVGRIIASSKNLGPFQHLLQVDRATVLTVLRSWGPGRFDAELILDGKAFRPDGKTAATLIPPALGLAGVNNHTWTGSWGSIPYWNSFVATLEMHGQGNFYDPRLENAAKYPVAARAGLGHVKVEEDLVTPKLPALQFYQVAIPTPKPPEGAFNFAAAKRGDVLFEEKAQCANCHMEPTWTDSGWNLHSGQEIGIDNFEASRAPSGQYRTTPLRALWDTEKMHRRGFYHDGRFQTLQQVIEHYNRTFNLRLTQQERSDLEQYLRSQ